MQVESGEQLFSRVLTANFELKGINHKLLADGGPEQNKTIEVAGTYCYELVVDFIARCILPPDINNEWKGLEVVFVNNTNHINIFKITKTLSAILKHHKVQDRKRVIELALKKITILKCYNEEQTLLTCANLEKLIERNVNISLLIVDNIASDYWIQRQFTPTSKFEIYCKNNLKIFQDIVKRMNLVMIFSRDECGSSPTSLPADYKIDCSANDKFCVFNVETGVASVVNVSIDEFITFI